MTSYNLFKIIYCGKVRKRMGFKCCRYFLHPFRICIGDWIKMNEAQHMSGKTKIIEWKVLAACEGEACTHAHSTYASFIIYLSKINLLVQVPLNFDITKCSPISQFLFIRRCKWNFVVFNSDTSEEGRQRRKKVSAKKISFDT